MSPWNNLWLRIIPIAGILSITAVFWYLITSFSLNIPINDDLQDVLLFVLTAVEADSSYEFIHAFLVQHADHKTASSRLVYWLVYSLQGDIDFRILIYSANTAIFVILGLLYKQLVDSDYKLLFLLAACACLLNPRSYSLLVWAMAGMQWYGCFVYGLATLFFLSKRSPFYYVLAVVAAFLATFSIASGTMIWPLGFLYLLTFEIRTSQVDRLRALVWALFALLAFTVFISGFSVISSALSVSTTSHLLTNPLYNVQFFLTLIGSPFAFQSVALAQLFGAVLFPSVIYFTYRGLRDGLTPLHFFTWYCLIAMAITSAARVQLSQFALFGQPPLLLEMALTPRYAFPAMVLSATLVTLLANTFGKSARYFKSGIVLLAVLASMGNYYLYASEVEKLYQSRVDRFNAVGLKPFFPSESWNATLVAVGQKNIYHPPDRPIEK